MAHPFQWFLGTIVGEVGLFGDVQWVFQHGGFGTPAAVNSYFGTNPMPETGPYVVTNVSPNSYVSFTQSSNYWGTNLSSTQIAADKYLDPGHVKNVVIYTKGDDLTRYVDLSSGAVR